MSEVFWLRSETKEHEFRRALDPSACKKLIEHGHKVCVEDWAESIIPIEEYRSVGCDIKKSGSWIEADKNTIIVGLKALPGNNTIFHHRHIFFAHVYKEQDGWKEIMSQFSQAGGQIIDLEYMVDDRGRRVCAFGYWAGYVGASLGALIHSASDLSLAMKELGEKKYFINKDDLISFIRKHIGPANLNYIAQNAIVIGSQGRSGNGATDSLSELGWNVTGWDKAETSAGGPFKEILNYDLFINCVLAMKKMPAFINKEMLDSNEIKLQVISDVSCDPDSDCNMVPLYKAATTIEAPFHTIRTRFNSLKITAIDNLPSVLPKESSEDFSSQLVEHLCKYTEKSGPVYNALSYFNKTQLKLK